jgi:hypothetical protein
MKASHSIPKIAICLSLLCLGACAAHAAPPGTKNKTAGDDFSLDARISGTIAAGISIGDARRLADQHHLTGSKPLPPGIRKNLARGKPMPPGIAKTRLPEGFIGGLPRHPGYEWQQAGADLVLVASGSLVISDILQGVFD